MTILTLRTDNPLAEAGLFNDGEQIDYLSWNADRKLAETINQVIEDLVHKNKLKLSQIEGLVVYEGPGSFTGLRIGLSVANALASSLNVPIVATTRDDWVSLGARRLQNGENEVIAMPEYGALPNITKPRK